MFYILLSIDDLGTISLRSAVDLINVLKCVLGLDDATSHAAMGRSATLVVKHGRNRRAGIGTSATAKVFSLKGKDNRVLPPASQNLKAAYFAADLSKLLPIAREVGEISAETKAAGDAEEDNDDGFITL